MQNPHSMARKRLNGLDGFGAVANSTEAQREFKPSGLFDDPRRLSNIENRNSHHGRMNRQFEGPYRNNPEARSRIYRGV